MQHAHTPTPTLHALWERFSAERSHTLCATTIATDYARVAKHLERCPVQELHRGREAMAWALGIEPRPTGRKVAMYVKAALAYAAQPDVGLLERSPVESFKMPRRKHGEAQSDVIVVQREEVQPLLLALEPQRHRGVQRNWRLVSDFMLQTGMRTGEVFALTMGDIRGDRALVHSNMTLTHGLHNSTKTGRKRSVPLNSRALEIVESLDLISDFEYLWPGGSQARKAYQAHFRRTADRLYEEGHIAARYRPYDLRHTAITRWLEAGIPVAQCARWAGNSTAVIFAHYVGVTEEADMPVL